jgi:cbb3-type cytochrome oxidase subunit 3
MIHTRCARTQCASVKNCSRLVLPAVSLHYRPVLLLDQKNRDCTSTQQQLARLCCALCSVCVVVVLLSERRRGRRAAAAKNKNLAYCQNTKNKLILPTEQPSPLTV